MSNFIEGFGAGTICGGVILTAIFASVTVPKLYEKSNTNFRIACAQAEWKPPICAKQIDDAVKAVKGEGK